MPNRTLNQRSGDALAMAQAEAVAEDALWDRHEQVLREIRETIQTEMGEQPKLSADEIRWVRLAIAREAKMAERWEAVVKKSLASLAWSGIVAIGVIVVSYLREHGWK
jgi:hypothetical protein